VTARTCSATKKDGEPCGAPPLQDDKFCFLHSPKTAKEAAEARRQGGLRRRREKVVSTVYDFEGLATIEGMRRVLEIVVTDALAQDNSHGRGRVLIAAVGTAAKLLEMQAEPVEGQDYERAIIGPDGVARVKIGGRVKELDL
jgi:hypothetical protein